MPTQSRQLAAIMFTDIVGYTAMMQKNESEALSKVDRYKQVQNEIVNKYDGNYLIITEMVA
jgi:class 3 adenylate cyclase